MDRAHFLKWIITHILCNSFANRLRKVAYVFSSHSSLQQDQAKAEQVGEEELLQNKKLRLFYILFHQSHGLSLLYKRAIGGFIIMTSCQFISRSIGKLIESARRRVICFLLLPRSTQRGFRVLWPVDDGRTRHSTTKNSSFKLIEEARRSILQSFVSESTCLFNQRCF